MPMRMKELVPHPDYREGLVATYELIHDNGVTTLRHDLEMRLSPVGVEVSFTLADFPEHKTEREASEKLAEWFERMAQALRDPGRTGSLPAYSGIGYPGDPV